MCVCVFVRVCMCVGVGIYYCVLCMMQSCDLIKIKLVTSWFISMVHVLDCKDVSCDRR